MSKRGTAGLVAKVDAEVVVELHSSVHRVAVDDEHHRALTHSYWTLGTSLSILQYLAVIIMFWHQVLKSEFPQPCCTYPGRTACPRARREMR